jgi:hypothetical protein
LDGHPELGGNIEYFQVLMVQLEDSAAIEIPREVLLSLIEVVVAEDISREVMVFLDEIAPNDEVREIKATIEFLHLAIPKIQDVFYN